MENLKERLLSAFDGMDAQAREEIIKLAEMYRTKYPAPRQVPVLRIVSSKGDRR